MANRNKHNDTKSVALRENGTLNPSPGQVADPKFQQSEFFDARDLVQVKYEMLRRVLVDTASVTEATVEYGVSRPTYYQTKASFDAGGLAGLVPKKPGPRGPHKLEGEVLRFVQSRHVPGQPVRARALAKLVREKFSIEIHARTIERALAVKKSPR
jgi:transposase